MTYRGPAHDLETLSINCRVRRTPVFARLAITVHTATSSLSVMKTFRRHCSEEKVGTSTLFANKQQNALHSHHHSMFCWPCITVYQYSDWPCNTVYQYNDWPCITVYQYSDWPCITVYQYSKPNVIHLLFNLLGIKGLYMFRALLAHPQEALHSGT
jgi:hypothetical protein